MHVQFGPVRDVVLWVEVRVKGVRTRRVLAYLSADLVGKHLLIELHLKGRMVKVLGLKWDMRHDVSVVDYSDDGGYSALQVHRKVLVSYPGTAECVNLLHVLILQLQLQSSNHPDCCAQTRTHHYQSFSPICLLQCFQSVVYLIANGEVGKIETFMHLAVLASWVIHLFESEILDPVDRIYCSSEYQQKLVQASTVAGIGHD